MFVRSLQRGGVADGPRLTEPPAGGRAHVDRRRALGRRGRGFVLTFTFTAGAALRSDGGGVVAFAGSPRLLAADRELQRHPAGCSAGRTPILRDGPLRLPVCEPRRPAAIVLGSMADTSRFLPRCRSSHDREPERERRRDAGADGEDLLPGRNLATARRIGSGCLGTIATVFLGAAARSAPWPAAVLAHLIAHRYVDCLVSTGANLITTSTNARPASLHRLPARERRAAAGERIDRVYDTYASEESSSTTTSGSPPSR